MASEIIGGPSSLTYDWPVWPADIFILDVPLTSCGLKVGAMLYLHTPSQSITNTGIAPLVAKQY